jgi:purine nucleoside permease
MAGQNEQLASGKEIWSGRARGGTEKEKTEKVWTHGKGEGGKCAEIG